MYMRILFNNIRIPTFFTDSLQSLSFPNHVNFIAWLVHHQILLQTQHLASEFPFTRFTAAQYQYHCHEQSTVPGKLLRHCSCRRNSPHLFLFSFCFCLIV
ncbi:Uncharacterized protein TCM_022527 [Theobroma cacao]|uniref:Uncharacterized protein n=1 Tax=Theobroma cacao TaxID=3641 RepID=A0A061EUZ4_THECC|nr:Uncharacterized protein TCM_022527 [Theobroma cacao]